MKKQNSPKKSPEAQQRHRVGFHATTAGGHYKAIEEGDAFGCEVIQVFTKNNLQWNAKPFSKTELEKYREAKKKSPISCIFGHSGYLINLAATNPETLQKSRESLVLELERSAELELPYLVLHPGAAKERTAQEGLDLVVESLEWVFSKTSSPTLVALEVTAGAGTILGSTIEQLAYLIDKTPSGKRLAICLDTCHLFASGYDLRTKKDVEDFIKKFKKLIDWKRVAAIHMNDSVGELGSKLDRHAPLGEGKIGWECFQTIMQHPDFAHLPLCMEIPPGDDRINDVVALKKLKALRGKN
jgi:deoxyribonuclease-4